MLVSFILRKSKNKAKIECKIYCKIIIGGRACVPFSTELSINPDEWNSTNQCATSERYAHITHQIAELKTSLFSIQMALAQDGEVTADMVASAYVGRGLKIGAVRVPTLKRLIQEFLKSKKEAVEQGELKAKSLYQYEIWAKLWAEDEAILVDAIDNEWLKARYKRGLGRGYSVRYLNDALHFLRAVLLLARRKKLYRCDLAELFDKVKRNPPPKELHFLTESKIEELEALPLTSKMAKVRDGFLFQCLTGMNYADLISFSKKTDLIQKNGVYWLDKARSKRKINGRVTSQRYSVPIFEKAQRLLNKYEVDVPFAFNRAFYFNNLKHLGELLGLPFKLTSHIGRKSAAMLFFEAGISVEVVAEMIGHQDIKTTLAHYVKIRQEKVLYELHKTNSPLLKIDHQNKKTD
jgi:integrase